MSGIVTPEAVVLEFETAGIGSRVIAGLIDLTVQGAALAAILIGIGTLASTGLDAGGIGAAIIYILVFLVIFGYPAAFETLWRGRTLGKAAMGLRVVTVEGAPIRFRHAAIRSIFSLVDWLATQGVVGITALLVTKRNQRVGDLVAGTIVLRERVASNRSSAPVQFVAPIGLEAYTATLATGAIGHEEYGSIRSFLLRAASLPPAVRHDLASQLAHPLVSRLKTTVPPGVSPEVFLICVAAAYQRRMASMAGRNAAGFSSVWSGLGNQVRWEGAGVAAARPSEAAAPTAAGDGFVAPG